VCVTLAQTSAKRGSAADIWARVTQKPSRQQARSVGAEQSSAIANRQSVHRNGVDAPNGGRHTGVMTLRRVLGQPRATDALRSALKGGSVHHAYLFAGPEGVGKELAAVSFAQALLCTQKPGDGCARCSACRRVERRSHPDVTWVMPEEEQVARGTAG